MQTAQISRSALRIPRLQQCRAQRDLLGPSWDVLTVQEVSPKMSWLKVCGWEKCVCSKKCGVAAARQTQILLGISLVAGSIQRSGRGAAVESYYCPKVSGWLCGAAGG